MRAISFPRLETITLATLAGLSVMYAYAACAFIFAPAHFAALMAEMGPLESVGALACLVAAILFFGVFVKALRSKSYGRALWLLGLAVVSALLALEEVSWGQHIFDFATPAGIAALNAQHERTFTISVASTLSRTSWASSYCLHSSSSRRCSPRMIDWRASSRRFRCRLCRCKSPRYSHSLTRGSKHFASSTTSSRHRE